MRSADASNWESRHSPGTVYVDGGARRGTGWDPSILSCHHVIDPPADILKALCLGATAVGIGRPFLYAQSVGSTIPNPVTYVTKVSVGIRRCRSSQGREDT